MAAAMGDKREKIMLKKFELSVAGGVQFGDLFASILCFNKLIDEGKTPEFCDPISGTPCKDPVDAAVEGVPDEAARRLSRGLVATPNAGRVIGGKGKTRKLRKQ